MTIVIHWVEGFDSPGATTGPAVCGAKREHEPERGMPRNQRRAVTCPECLEWLENKPADDNVIKWPKTRGPDIECAQCKEPIKKGQQYAMVRLPEGGLAAVHGDCLAGDKDTD